jgi:predicted translin family RNA/ssDNA-binding protein
MSSMTITLPATLSAAKKEILELRRLVAKHDATIAKAIAERNFDKASEYENYRKNCLEGLQSFDSFLAFFTPKKEEKAITPAPVTSYISRKAEAIKAIIAEYRNNATLAQINSELRKRGYSDANILVSFMKRDSVLVVSGQANTTKRGKKPFIYSVQK